MKISVIIPTFNEESVIEECLESLDKQSVKDFEVIIVDDGSDDTTLKLIEGYKPSIYKLLLKKQSHKGPGAARNLGAKSASGKVFVFVDADMTFERNFLDNLTKPIIKGSVKGTFSKEEYVSNWENVWARCWNFNEGWEAKKRHPKNYPDTQKVFRAILKSEFNKIGGFTPGGYNDDWSLAEKLGYGAENAPGAKFYHRNPDNLTEIFNHAQWVGKRKYKMGMVGYVAALIRSSFPVSIIVGLYKMIGYHEDKFIIFKVVYDFGVFVGIIKMMLLKQLAK